LDKNFIKGFSSLFEIFGVLHAFENLMDFWNVILVQYWDKKHIDIESRLLFSSVHQGELGGGQVGIIRVNRSQDNTDPSRGLEKMQRVFLPLNVVIRLRVVLDTSGVVVPDLILIDLDKFVKDGLDRLDSNIVGKLCGFIGELNQVEM